MLDLRQGQGKHKGPSDCGTTWFRIKFLSGGHFMNALVYYLDMILNLRTIHKQRAKQEDYFKLSRICLRACAICDEL
ncbi:hypothetical protein Tco_0682758 [Tanacetum coccineum]|uniref:Uncharacterized protein n=1 Tax=Tanacetum coccineum TaxID=301880 RepID=A0ABQ4XU04_9ASTR